jgi:hypothetical protein
LPSSGSAGRSLIGSRLRGAQRGIVFRCDCYRDKGDLLAQWAHVLEPPYILPPLKQLALLLRASTLADNTLRSHFPGIEEFNDRVNAVGMKTEAAWERAHRAWVPKPSCTQSIHPWPVPNYQRHCGVRRCGFRGP